MRQETQWQVISEIAMQQGSCIRPIEGLGHDKARADFMKYGADRIRYYSFPIPSQEGQRGYLRAVLSEDPRGIFIDFMSPINDRGKPFADVADWLNETSKMVPVYIPTVYLERGIQIIPGEPAKLNKRKFRKGLKHTAHLSTNLSLDKVDLSSPRTDELPPRTFLEFLHQWHRLEPWRNWQVPGGFDLFP